MSNKSEDIWDQYAWGIRRPPASISPTIHEKVRKRSFNTIALFMAVHVVDWPADSLLRGNFVVALVFRKALIFLGAAALGTDNGGTLVEQSIFNALAMFREGIRWYSIGWGKLALARFF